MLIFLPGCEEKAPGTSEARPVRTVVVHLQRIDDEHHTVGEIRPRQESDIGFRISGKLITRFVDIGAMVKKGDILALLDDQDYRNRQQSTDADVRAAEAVLIEAEGTESRQRRLLRSGVTTAASHETATKNLASALAKLDSAKIVSAMAKDQLGYNELRADFGGIVTDVGAENGQVVNVGQMIVRLAPPSEKDAVFAVAESQLKGFSPKEHSEVIVTLLSDPSFSTGGVVREVSPVADPATRTYLVKVTLHNPPEQMLFGSSVVGRLKTTTAPVVVLPGSALFDKAGKSAVWIYQRESRSVVLKTVVIARFETDRVIIAEGLVQGDVVITAGVNRLQEGQKVRLLDDAQQ